MSEKTAREVRLEGVIRELTEQYVDLLNQVEALEQAVTVLKAVRGTSRDTAQGV